MWSYSQFWTIRWVWHDFNPFLRVILCSNNRVKVVLTCSNGQCTVIVTNGNVSISFVKGYTSGTLRVSHISQWGSTSSLDFSGLVTDSTSCNACSGLHIPCLDLIVITWGNKETVSSGSQSPSFTIRVRLIDWVFLFTVNIEFENITISKTNNNMASTLLAITIKTSNKVSNIDWFNNLKSVNISDADVSVLATWVEQVTFASQGWNESTLVYWESLIEISGLPDINLWVSSTSVSDTILVISNASEWCGLTLLTEETLLSFLFINVPELNMFGTNGTESILTILWEANVEYLTGITLIGPDKISRTDFINENVVLIVEINTGNIPVALWNCNCVHTSWSFWQLESLNFFSVRCIPDKSCWWSSDLTSTG